jgi:hypothetical protein
MGFHFPPTVLMGHLFPCIQPCTWHYNNYSVAGH